MEGRARVAHQAAAYPPPPANPSSPLHQVISTAMQKTIVVAVTRVKTVPKYKVQIKRTKKFMAHDEVAAASLGDVVRIESCRPLSKRKAWALAEVLRRERRLDGEEAVVVAVAPPRALARGFAAGGGA